MAACVCKTGVTSDKSVINAVGVVRACVQSNKQIVRPGNAQDAAPAKVVLRAGIDRTCRVKRAADVAIAVDVEVGGLLQ